MIFPELLISLLYCEKMEDNEAIVVIGAEQFTDFRGYAHTFEALDKNFGAIDID